MKQCVLTTIDNEFNPFTQFDEWLAYDTFMNHGTCGMLAFFAKTSNEMDEEDYNETINDAINEILSINPTGLHYKLYEDEAETLIPLMNKVYKELKAKGEFD